MGITTGPRLKRTNNIRIYYIYGEETGNVSNTRVAKRNYLKGGTMDYYIVSKYET